MIELLFVIINYVSYIIMSFLSSHQQFLHIAYVGIDRSIHPSIYPSIYSYHWSSKSSFTILFNIRYCNISWLNISSGSCIKDSIIRVFLNMISYRVRNSDDLMFSWVIKQYLALDKCTSWYWRQQVTRSIGVWGNAPWKIAADRQVNKLEWRVLDFEIS